MYQNFCKKCGSTELHTEQRGNNTGLFCSRCNAYIKWLGKDELRLFLASQSALAAGNIRGVVPEQKTGFVQKTESVQRIEKAKDTQESTIYERLEKFRDFLEEALNFEMSLKPLSEVDAVRKSACCLAMEKDKNAIQNILNGYDFDEEVNL